MSVLILRHVPHIRLGHLPSVLEELKFPFRTIHSAQEALPSLDGVDGVIVMGGPMSAYDKGNHPWIEAEEGYLRAVHKRRIPLLGICLGGQILAQAFGAKVRPADEAEIGWYSVRRTYRDALLEEIPHLFEYHYDEFELPQGATHMARSDRARNQMFRLSPTTWGVQFHPEANEVMISSLMAQFGDTELAGDIGKRVIENAAARAAAGRKFLFKMLSGLLGQNSEAVSL